MPDLSIFKVDLDAVRPNPSNPTQTLRGDAPRTAFGKLNDMLDVLHSSLRHVGPVSPPNPVAGMQWADPVTEPPTEYVRNNANTAWILVSGPTDNRPKKHAEYTLASLPNPATWLRHTIIVTNASGGPKMCMSNGTQWNLLNTNTQVS